MRYMVEVLDDSKNKTAELSGMVRAHLREKINGIATLTVENIEAREWDYITSGTSFLRLRTAKSPSYTTFRIYEVNKARHRERPSLTIHARQVLADTADEVFADAVDCVNYTPSQLAELALGYSSFDTGTIEPTTVVPYVRFEYDSVFDCLLRICSLTGAEMVHDEENGEIDLLSTAGSSNGVIFRYGLNLKRASRIISTSRLANRIYGVGGGSPPLTLTDATPSGGNKYASDTSSITTYGFREASYHDPTLEDVVNLVATPALDGAYSSGLCENWTKAGNPTVGKNTNASYYLYGRASQRIQSTASGEGITQDVAVSQGKCYSLLVNILLTSGTVRVEVEDGTSVYKRAEPVTGTGLATIRIENWKANTTTATVKIYQDGTGSADFYVDSVQVAEGARVKPFTIGKSADTLWNRTVEYLNARKDPEISYEIDLVDLYGDLRAGREADKFGIGDTISVIDPTLGLDVETRVMEREVDILHPWRVKVRLDNPARNLADVITAISKAQQEGVKRTRAAMAESSTAAETGSTRLGFSNQAFRFFSTLSADTWDGISWDSGTLRAGDAYYSISSGSATSLSGTSTYYFYFDRTNPATFGYTTSIETAEGDDRILVFAVTTTSSPTLCQIHPLGIIHV